MPTAGLRPGGPPVTDVVFEASGIHCQSCERTIRTLLDEVDGVERVSADHRTGRVAVS